MALQQRLEVKMLQKLILTPQLQQAIKLLQLPQIELSEVINNELVENPFLEEETVEPLPEEAPPPDRFEEETFEASESEDAPLDRLMGFGVDEYFDSRSYDGRDLGYFSPDFAQTQTIDQYVSEGSDLTDHLNWQLRLSAPEGPVRLAAEAVIGNIDENGYLQATDVEIASAVNVSLNAAADAVALVQGFDPPGIAARDLRECLVMQLGSLGLQDTLVEKLIQHNLRDIEKRRYKRLAAQYQCSEDDIRQAVQIIESLQPRPGGSMSGIQPIYIKPDVYIIRDEDDFRIVLNDDHIPSLRINSYYRKILSTRGSLNKEERDFLNERLKSAVWLLKSLDHRNKTIYRVSESILNFQREFFEKGVASMKPLNLKDVARDLGMHESTISRTTSNKYLSCSHGLFNFRYFFSSGIKGDYGTVSSTSIKDMIEKIVDEENPRKPLSDQKIADMLKELNVKVARRTVAKYRDELNIQPQNLRKRHD
jgi:RNA polymerase sigma-54 factor